MNLKVFETENPDYDSIAVFLGDEKGLSVGMFDVLQNTSLFLCILYIIWSSFYSFRVIFIMYLLFLLF